MEYEYIRTAEQLAEFCDHLQTVDLVAWDTEFVSEDTYRPDLCLVQVAAGGRSAVIDPHAIVDLRPFWDVICSDDRLSVVHAGREEVRFCLHALGHGPPRLFDTQIAAGMIGLEYPASYARLLARLLNRHLHKGETRTDWRRRPLSERQLEYALQDVIYLEPMHGVLMQQLGQLGRGEWLETEMLSWQEDLREAEQRENWRRVSGTSGLSDKSMVIVRELWRWREAEAARQNRPARRVLRDDLIVELARRGKADERQLAAIRGLERCLAKRHFPAVAECIRLALELPREEWPERPVARATNHTSLVGQFISTALTSICRAQMIAPGLVGTVQDVRELVEFRLQGAPEDGLPIPSLAQGWRAEVVGKVVDRLLAGEVSIRIADPRSEEPLVFEPYDGSADSPT